MKHLKTKGIILKRTNYGEADRILALLTSDMGKIRAIAKGVRKQKSKLAGGLEVFSVSSISLIQGKGEMFTIVSTRLDTHYGHIVKELNRTMAMYDCLKTIDSHAGDNCESAYFDLLHQTLQAMNEKEVPADVVKVWFEMQLLKLLGSEPNLSSDNQQQKLEGSTNYQFDYEAMSFFVHKAGAFKQKHVKFLRLLLSEKPKRLATISEADGLAKDVSQLTSTLLQYAGR